MKKKIFSSYAFTENERDKSKINHEIYNKIKDKAEIVSRWNLYKITDKIMKEKICLIDWEHGYAHTNYKILSNPYKLSDLQLALICDGGNLCFGYSISGNVITVYTD